MTHQHVASPAAGHPDLPEILSIGPSDVKEALVAGLDDFMAMPTHVIFLVIIYPILGILLTRITMGEGLLPLVYPLMAGFTLVGPFAAIGLYELSRRRELGQDASFRHAFDVLRSPARGSIALLGLVQLLIFAAWIAVAHALYVSLIGAQGAATFGELTHQLFETPAGLTLIVVGNALGFLFAVAALTLSVVSFPLLVDRNVGASAAMWTSARAVLRNPGTMALWGLVVAALLLVGSVPFFIGLAVVMPVLGHATWHLYRRVVAPVR